MSRPLCSCFRESLADVKGKARLWIDPHFKPAVLKAGLPPALRFHHLRHTRAALLIAQGGHPKAIMERLGHSSIQVTLDRYGHPFPGLDEALTDGLEATYRASIADREHRPEPSLVELA